MKRDGGGIPLTVKTTDNLVVGVIYGVAYLTLPSTRNECKAAVVFFPSFAGLHIPQEIHVCCHFLLFILVST
jgi:hypothetical protein